MGQKKSMNMEENLAGLKRLEYKLPFLMEDRWNDERTLLRLTYRQARKFAGQNHYDMGKAGIEHFHHEPDVDYYYIEKNNVRLIKQNSMYFLQGKEDDILNAVEAYELDQERYNF